MCIRIRPGCIASASRPTACQAYRKPETGHTWGRRVHSPAGPGRHVTDTSYGKREGSKEDKVSIVLTDERRWVARSLWQSVYEWRGMSIPVSFNLDERSVSWNSLDWLCGIQHDHIIMCCSLLLIPYEVSSCTGCEEEWWHFSVVMSVFLLSSFRNSTD